MKPLKKQPEAWKSVVAGKSLSKKFVSDALNSIEEVVPHIHRVKLRLKNGDDSTIQSVFGFSNFHVMNAKEGRQAPNFSLAGNGNFGKNKYTIWTGRKMAFLSKYMFSVVGPTQKDLYYLSFTIPGIEVSSVEYSIDMFCENYKKVSALFYILRRYMYFPYRDKTVCKGGAFGGIESERTENCAWFIWDKAHGAKCLTVYERGSDDKKDGAGWKIEDIDRVRVEFVAKNKTKVFKNNGITKLSDFVKNPHFHKIVSDKFDFRRFKSSSQFPKDWDDFNAPDNSGYLECFQEEYISAKQKCKNVSQCIEPATNLLKLRKRMLSHMIAFDDKWVRAYKKNILDLD